jgi:hypothetical protein
MTYLLCHLSAENAGGNGLFPPKEKAPADRQLELSGAWKFSIITHAEARSSHPSLVASEPAERISIAVNFHADQRSLVAIDKKGCRVLGIKARIHLANCLCLFQQSAQLSHVA